MSVWIKLSYYAVTIHCCEMQKFLQLKSFLVINQWCFQKQIHLDWPKRHCHRSKWYREISFAYVMKHNMRDLSHMDSFKCHHPERVTHSCLDDVMVSPLVECFHLYWPVSLFDSQQHYLKYMNRIWWNFQDRFDMGQWAFWNILGQTVWHMARLFQLLKLGMAEICALRMLLVLNQIINMYDFKWVLGTWIVEQVLYLINQYSERK